MNSPKRRSLCWVFRLIGVIAAGTCLGFAPPNFAAQVPTVQQLADRYWSLYCARFPTQCALDRQDPLSGELEDLSPAANRKWQQDLNALLIDVDRIPRPTLSADDRLTLDLLQRCIRDEILRASLPWALVPITPVSGPQIDLTQVYRQAVGEENFISRMQAFPKQVADLELNMHAAAQSGFVLPCVLIERILPQIDMSTIGHRIVEELRTERNKADPKNPAKLVPVLAPSDSLVSCVIASHVEPALRSLHAYLLDEYMPLCRSSIGLGDVAGGDAIYAAALRLHATIPIKPEVAHEMGLREVGRLKQLLDKEKFSSGPSILDRDEIQERRNFNRTFIVPSHLPAFRGCAGVPYAYWYRWYIFDYLPMDLNRLPSALGISSSLVGRYTAAMLVIDTGIHAKGWTYDQAVAYMRENTARTDAEIESDVIRCISLPGEAAGAEIGWEKFNALRQEAEGKLGDRFDLRVFNEFMLSGGPMPLDMLEMRMRMWIAEQAKSP